jgi:hypothetical protein
MRAVHETPPVHTAAEQDGKLRGHGHLHGAFEPSSREAIADLEGSRGQLETSTSARPIQGRHILISCGR